MILCLFEYSFLHVYGHAHKYKIVVFQCVKSVQIRSYFWSVFSRIRREYGEMRSTIPQLYRGKEKQASPVVRTIG